VDLPVLAIDHSGLSVSVQKGKSCNDTRRIHEGSGFSTNV